MPIPPREFCERLNRFISPNVLPGKFITFFYGMIDVANKTLQYTNAGHNPPILVRRDGAVVRLQNNRELDAAALQKSVLNAVKEFGNGNFEDDVTLLALVIE